ncbi:hypothetical protein [Arsenicibacter rosenii]|uniref:Uncharacterized protein n=1 Tax=Arsenicibacter rosenii TaxID=1750698 RepID=A0A1S2VPT7_9BACT|nr:hypothetical protein [Arsenicibacter rosenii]OIN59808.1 hypothetical protein BLX24_08090 [Arsenicibacter rosenii]
MEKVDLSSINSFMTFESFDTDVELGMYLFSITSQKYTIAQASERTWGQVRENGLFYQIMPEGLDNGFFDWYISERPDHQFFRTVEMAVLYFIFYWNIWNSLNH